MGPGEAPLYGYGPITTPGTTGTKEAEPKEGKVSDLLGQLLSKFDSVDKNTTELNKNLVAVLQAS